MEISVELISKLRNLTGAGVLDCKNALIEAKNDIELAIKILREKGKAAVLKLESREAKNGGIFSYIHHDGRIGVLLELRCETDFVARTDEFKHLAKELTLQIAAMAPLWISTEDIPPDIIEKEKEIYKKQILDTGKPEHVIEKIVENKLKDFFSRVCLMEQTYVRNQNEKIKDIITATSSKLGERILVKRFIRFVLGGEE